MICNCVRSIPAVAGVTDVVKPERRRLVTVVVGAERCDALRSTLAPVIAGDAFDQSWVGVTAKDVCNRHLLAGSEELERSIPADTWFSFLRSHGIGHNAGCRNTDSMVQTSDCSRIGAST